MEVVIPTRQGMDFEFNEAHPMAYLSAPTTPKRFGDCSSSSFLSAPSSPSRVAELYGYFDDLSTKEEEEFAFDFGSELGGNASPLSTADELFHGGKIKPSRPHQHDDALRSPLLSSPRPSSPRSPIARGKRIIKEAFSPRGKKDSEVLGAERGRERVSGPGRSSSRRGSRSLSPYRVSGYPWEEEEATKQPALDSKTSSVSSSSKSSSRKWKLKDLLLFRSASEGRSSHKDPLRKYSAVTLFRTRKPQSDQDGKNSSFRSMDGGSASPAKATRMKAPAASAHELHYTANKAVSDDLKKKTFLPYRYGLLGRLAFNPSVHSLSN